MFRRRFTLLTGLLAALGVMLVLAAPGLAIRQAIVNQLLGPKMVRAQVLERTGAQWNLDRGVITQVNGTQLTLQEADGRIQPIALSSSTKVIRRGASLPLSLLAPKWHVLVTWPASGPALFVDVEKVPKTRAKPVGALRRVIVNQLFGPKMVRAQILAKNGSQWNLDRGVVTQVNGTQLTLREADGRVQPIDLLSTTKVIRLGSTLSVSDLAPRSHVLVTWPATGPAVSVDVEKLPPHGKGAR